MRSSRPSLAFALLVGLALLAGCGALFGTGDASQSTTTVTPAPVSEITETSTPAPEDKGMDSLSRDETNQSAAVQERYSSLRPNCDRPPGLVIHIQVAALQHNDPETDAGINTTWQFAAPSNKQHTGPYANFAETIKSFYRPLLEAERVAYDPIQKSENTASRQVNVTNGTGATTAYDWRLEKQSTGRFDGCWMTVSVQELG